MGRMVTCLATMGLLWAAGCADQPGGISRCPGACSYLAVQARPTPYLLFDRAEGPALRPGIRPTTAQDFAYRSEWPSTSGYYSGGEAVFYLEHYYDNQTGNGDASSYLSRRFESYRVGAGFR